MKIQVMMTWELGMTLREKAGNKKIHWICMSQNEKL